MRAKAIGARRIAPLVAKIRQHRFPNFRKDWRCGVVVEIDHSTDWKRKSVVARNADSTFESLVGEVRLTGECSYRSLEQQPDGTWRGSRRRRATRGRRSREFRSFQ